MRHDQPSGTAIEDGADGAYLDRMDAHQRGQAAGLCAHAQVGDLAQREHAVLGIDVKAVEARFLEDEDRIERAQLAQRHELDKTAVGQFAAQVMRVQACHRRSGPRS